MELVLAFTPHTLCENLAVYLPIWYYILKLANTSCKSIVNLFDFQMHQLSKFCMHKTLYEYKTMQSKKHPNPLLFQSTVSTKIHE